MLDARSSSKQTNLLFMMTLVRRLLTLVCALFAFMRISAQTDVDGIMMSKNNFCTGFMYSYSSWENYWEGKLKRDALNLGTVSTQMIGWMGNYGITDKLNIMAGVPYVKTKSSAGTLHGVDGIQDLSVTVKYRALEKEVLKGKLAIMGVVGLSVPISNYVADYLPLAIGLRSNTGTFRVIADFERNHFFFTGAAAYVLRSNITIDRDAYYTTELHMTNKVEMPDMVNFHVRFGYRGNSIGAEAVFTNMTTLGGFDITRNNMPFPSNRMNATTAGINIKCNPRALPGLSVLAGAGYTLAGRNVGQATMFNGGLFYVFDFGRKVKTSK
jgi:hypothetical protein